MRPILFSICVLWNVCSLGQWVSVNGPYGGRISDLAAIGTKMFASTEDGGVFLTSDTGNTWTLLNNGLPANVTSLGVNGTDLFAGTSSGIYVSANHGSSWTFLTDSMQYPTGFGFIGSNIFVSDFYDGVYISSNNGITWNPVNNGLTYTTVKKLVISGNNLFAGTSYYGIYRSTNNGASWTQVNSGLTNLVLRSLVVHDTTLFAACGNDVFRSTNNGLSWTLVNNGLPPYGIGAFYSLGNNLFAGSLTGDGVYLTTDNGNSWVPVNNGFDPVEVTSFASFGSNLIAGTSGAGCFLTYNNGNSWSRINNGITNQYIRSLAFHDSILFAGYLATYRYDSNVNSWTVINDSICYYGLLNLAIHSNDSILFSGINGLGIFSSSDNGNQWTQTNTGLTDWYTKCIIAFQDTLFTGNHDGVFSSADNGALWTPKNTGLTSLDVTALAANTSRIFAGVYPDGLYVSDDNGNSWTLSLPSSSGFIYAIMPIDSIIFVGLGSSIYRSFDNGNSWTQLGFGPVFVQSFAHAGNKVFVGTGSGVFLSTDNGDTWTPVNSGLPNYPNSTVWSLTVSGSKVYAGTSSGVYVDSMLACPYTYSTISANSCSPYVSPSGQIWNSGGIYSDTIPNSTGCDSIITINLTILPDPTVTIAASGAVSFCQGDSVVLSASPGMTGYQWYRWNTAIPGASLADYVAKVRGRYKCVAYNAAFCDDTSNVIVVSVPCIPIGPNHERANANEVSEKQLLQIFPNPGTGIFSVQSPSGQLQVFNSIGQEILSAEISEELSSFDISEYLDGIYFVTLTTGEMVHSEIILMAR